MKSEKLAVRFVLLAVKAELEEFTGVELAASLI